jgi:hypothetical protein
MAMKTIDTAAYLLCAGAILFAGAAFHSPVADAQTAQGQSQSQSDKVRQLQSQPPKINTEQEWKAAVEFMQANCPNRINFVISQLQDKRPIQFDHAKELILKQYRQISSIKDQETYNLAKAQAQIQDQVFGAQLEYRAAKARNDQRGMFNAKKALTAIEEQQVEVQIALRSLRIKRLQKEIDDFNMKRRSYVDNWTNDELKRAINTEFDDGANRSGNATIEDPPPVKK